MDVCLALYSLDLRSMSGKNIFTPPNTKEENHISFDAVYYLYIKKVWRTAMLPAKLFDYARA